MCTANTHNGLHDSYPEDNNVTLVNDPRTPQQRHKLSAPRRFVAAKNISCFTSLN